MIEEKRFILDKIKELISIFSNSMIGYEYKKESKIHFIKIKPAKLYMEKDFKKTCNNMLFEYIDKFKGSICFITEDDPYLLDNPVIFINPGKSIINDNHYNSHLLSNEGLTNKISSVKMSLNNNYSLAA